MRSPEQIRRRVRVIVLAGVVFLMAPWAAVGAQLEVDRLEIFLAAAASGASGAFAVRNVSDTARTVTITLQDWERDIDGVNLWRDAGTTRGSCSPAIDVFPRTLLLGGGETQSVRVTYSGGARATSCWSMISVEAAPLPATGQGAARVTVNLVQGVKVYVQPAEARPALVLDSIDAARHRPPPGAPPSDTLGNDVVAVVSNPGVIQTRVNARVEYRTVGDSVVHRTVVPQFPVLPGAARRVRSPIPPLPAGRYVVLMFFDFGGTEIIAGRLDLQLTQ